MTAGERYAQPILIGTALVTLTIFALFNGIDPMLLAVSIIVAAKPLMLAAIGELVVEKSGVLNLGVEGMMIIGAVCGFAVAVESGSPLLGFAGGAIGGALLALVFGVLTQYLLSSQVPTGLALTLFGLGLAALIGQTYSGVKPPPFPRMGVPFLNEIPLIGPLLFSHDAMVYVAVAIVAGVWYFLNRTRGGLVLRAVGENHDAAHSLGYNVTAIRMAAIAFGGACAGLGGAYLSLVRVPQWNEGMTAGAGWIALAIVVFGAWKPWRVLLGAYLFGGVTILQLNFQAANITPLWFLAFGFFLFSIWRTLTSRGKEVQVLFLWLNTIVIAVIAVRAPISIQSQYLSMTPYLVTIIVLVVMSADRVRASLNAPASLGRVFHKTG